MSDLPGNPHYRNLEEGYTTSNPDHAATVQTEALLALAYEIRTGNLIAREQLWATIGENYPEDLTILNQRLGDRHVE